MNPCFHPLYRGTWFPTSALANCHPPQQDCFHPLYRGTWFPTEPKGHLPLQVGVSIRYIAVLGFQRRVTVFMDVASTKVSIRYIAVLGFQQSMIKS